MGGYLLMRLALLDPGAMRRLVNLHSPGLPTPRMHALSAAFAILPRPASVLGRLVRWNPERWVHKNVHYYDETLKSREEHREYARGLLDDGGIEAFAGNLSETLDASEMARFERNLRELGKFPIPLQLVYAERDPMVPPSVGERLSTLLPDARFERLSAASHFAHVDAPEAFLRVAVPFLER
jgi:pimeloyl-ACP methyl ester carboxylesterase